MSMSHFIFAIHTTLIHSEGSGNMLTSLQKDKKLLCCYLLHRILQQEVDWLSAGPTTKSLTDDFV